MATPNGVAFSICRKGVRMATYDIKRKCVELAERGVKYRDIYNENIKENSSMSFRSFCRRMAEWKSKVDGDGVMLDTANLAYKFSPNASTVQVNGNGEVIQAWIKQTADNRIDEILGAIKDNTPTLVIKPKAESNVDGMLEIPLFDMHFGIADLAFYQKALEKILRVIASKRWDYIVIPVGQDLFHNDSIDKGITAKGTIIEKVDMRKAFYDAKTFYYNIIDAALQNANKVDVIYSAGNHDRTVGWMFVQVLKARYGDIVDDSTKERKALLWNGCFLGITHGSKKGDTISGLRGYFTMEYPVQFASANTREIHAGHLHREDGKDEYGVQVRRLSTGNKDDDWTIDEGYKSQKRFMLFEYTPNELKSIHYVYV